MKRLVRLQGTQIVDRLEELKNQYADYILGSGSVIHAKYQQQKGDQIIVKNAINNKVKIAIAELVEVVFDKES